MPWRPASTPAATEGARRRHARHRLWRLAWPLILANLSVPLLGLVDTAVLGHLPEASALGGVALAGVVFSVLYWGFGFLRMGTTALVAQARGRRDDTEVRAALLRAAGIAVALGVLLVAAGEPIGALAWALLKADEAVLAAAQHYYAIRLWSAPATLLNYVLLGFLLGLQVRHAPLVLLLVLNLGNAALDLWWVWGLGWGVAGAAWASLVAEYLTLVLGLLWIWRLLKRRPAPWPAPARLWAADAVRRLWQVNGDLFLRTLLLLFALGFFTAQSARMDPVTLAANAVLLNFLTLLAYALDGIAHALEALVGESAGAGDRAAVQRWSRVGAEAALAFAALFSGVYLLAGEVLIALLTDLAPVREVAAAHLPWVIAAPWIAVWSYLLDGLYIGTTRTRELRDGMVLAVALVYLPLWWLSRPWGNHGLWFSLLAFLAARALFLAWWWRRHEKGPP